MQIKHYRCFFLAFITSILPTLSQHVWAATLADFRQDIRHFIRDNTSLPSNTELKITIAPLKSKATFINACQAGFDFRFTGLSSRSRNTVITQCKDTPQKKIYIPVKIQHLIPTVTVNTTLSRNQIIKEKHLEIINMEQKLHQGDYIENPQDIIGARIKRGLKAGKPLKKKDLCFVCKGDLVDVIAATGAITVVTEGQALEDGLQNEWINLKNVRTGIHVQAKIAQDRQVWVIPQDVEEKTQDIGISAVTDTRDDFTLQENTVMAIDKLNGNNIPQDGIKQAKQVKANVSPASSEKASEAKVGAPAADSLKLTEVALQLQKLQVSTEQNAGINQDNVARIRALINDNNYAIDARSIAEKLARSESDLDSK